MLKHRLVFYGSKENEKNIVYYINANDVAGLKGLIYAGADVTAKNNDGETALMIEHKKHETKIERLLRDAGAEE